MTLRVLISAGEVSGDQHLGRVVQAIKARMPEAEVRGMGGKECREAGADLVVDCYKSGAAMGFSELLRSAGSILGSFRCLSSLIKSWRPQVVILVDYPDFNLRLARVAKKAGCKVLYYIPPKVWAWRTGRVEKIKRYVDRIAAIFPFERDFYERHGYQSVTYVGHPLADQNSSLASEVQRNESVLFLPGSRKFEVERLLPPMLRAFERVRSVKPQLRGTVLLAANMSEEFAKQIAITAVKPETFAAIDWSNGTPLLEMQRARVAALKSGTCNLEGALAELPFVSVYSGSRLSKVIVWTFVALKEYSPVNIIKPGAVRELMHVKLDDAELARELLAIYDDGPVRDRILTDLKYVRTALIEHDAERSVEGATVSERVAQMVFNMAEL
ncbi:MAG: lipid-A-disaccharide synthase [bacterium]